ncbi:interferon-induced protein 44-like [Neoarius graeffei]|uniref:interferon-induced protein 44-like n=1 Tax=Neoarius graeffei TaxID=443677 RepID=UPI00298C8386|nr:interferon-induced protein 44-like [Neoarius graeffei]
MGSSPSRPEFVTVLANRQVSKGQNVVLSCDASTEDVTKSWGKDGEKLDCVQGKHVVKNVGKRCILEISKAEASDEGEYTITLTNKSGSISCSASVRVEINEWREVQWREKGMLDSLKAFQICNEIQELRFQLYGPVGAGKSSIINTIGSIFEGRQSVSCSVAAGSTKSHTLNYERFRFANGKGSFPFAFNDVMGAEAKLGVLTEDIILALKGHMKEGYLFNEETPLSERNLYYNQNPSLSDQMHCLVFVAPADKISLMNKNFIGKLKHVRDAASRMGIPQVVFMTRVDCACPMTKENLRNIYKSRKIREKMHECSNVLGVPVNCIFPVLNYHEETHMNKDINCLMLDALTQIINWANDYVVRRANI